MPIINKQTAKVRLWVGMPAGQKNMEWYNFLNENTKPYEIIVREMERRLLSKFAGKFQTAIFYDAQTNKELKRISN